MNDKQIDELLNQSTRLLQLFYKDQTMWRADLIDEYFLDDPEVDLQDFAETLVG